MEAIPMPERQHILQLYERGGTTHGIAKYSGYCLIVVRRKRQQFEARVILKPHIHLCEAGRR